MNIVTNVAPSPKSEEVDLARRPTIRMEEKRTLKTTEGSALPRVCVGAANAHPAEAEDPLHHHTTARRTWEQGLMTRVDEVAGESECDKGEDPGGDEESEEDGGAGLWSERKFSALALLRRRKGER
jgi:hypothetical protein